MSSIIPVEVIAEKIFEIRSQKVMIDADLAKLYGVPTKRLNESVKRNAKRFPEDLMFQLSMQERDELVANCDRFTNMKHSSALPHAFTEVGVAMLSSVLNSETAIQINLQIIRASACVGCFLIMTLSGLLSKGWNGVSVKTKEIFSLPSKPFNRF